MLPCYEGSVWLIIDVPCPLDTVIAMAKSLADFSQFQAKTKKVVCGQHTKETTAGPFHFLHMGPMSDVAML
jgi:hypothetical protein